MGYNCKWTEAIIGIVIIVFVWWQVGTSVSQWIVTVAAALLILHAFRCDNCSVNVSSVKKGKRK